jgi:extracellular matrix regulatory protein A
MKGARLSIHEYTLTRLRCQENSLEFDRQHLLPPPNFGYKIEHYSSRSIVHATCPSRTEGNSMNDVELVHIGFNNVIAMNRVIAIVSPTSAPTKRTIQEGRTKGMLIDMTNGRRTKAVIISDSGHIILAALAPETIAGRLQSTRDTAERLIATGRLESNDARVMA